MIAGEILPADPYRITDIVPDDRLHVVRQIRYKYTGRILGIIFHRLTVLIHRLHDDPVLIDMKMRTAMSHGDLAALRHTVIVKYGNAEDRIDPLIALLRQKLGRGQDQFDRNIQSSFQLLLCKHYKIRRICNDDLRLKYIQLAYQHIDTVRYGIRNNIVLIARTQPAHFQIGSIAGCGIGYMHQKCRLMFGMIKKSRRHAVEQAVPQQRSVDLIMIIVPYHRQRISRGTRGLQSRVLSEQQGIILRTAFQVLPYHILLKLRIRHPFVVVRLKLLLFHHRNITEGIILRQILIEFTEIRRMLSHVVHQRGEPFLLNPF